MVEISSNWSTIVINVNRSVFTYYETEAFILDFFMKLFDFYKRHSKNMMTERLKIKEYTEGKYWSKKAIMHLIT